MEKDKKKKENFLIVKLEIKNERLLFLLIEYLLLKF